MKGHKKGAKIVESIVFYDMKADTEKIIKKVFDKEKNKE